MRTATWRPAILCLSLAIAGGLSQSADARPDSNDDEVQVLVKLNVSFNAEGKLPEVAREHQRKQIHDAQAALLDELASEARLKTKYQTVPYVALQMRRSALRHLEHSPRVAHWEIDSLGKFALFDSVPLIGAPAAHAANLTGSNMVVAIVDTGVNKFHSYLTNRVVSEACYSTSVTINGFPQYESVCPGGASSSTATDSGLNCDVAQFPLVCGHGTNMAGIVSAKNIEGGFLINGVTRHSSLISIQMATRANGSADCGGAPPCIGVFKSDAIEALERVYALAQGSFPVAAVNFGGTFILSGEPINGHCDTSTFAEVIANLASVGVATIAPVANNNAVGTIGEPACVSTAIAVGMTTKSDTIYTGAGASNTSNALDLLAPGIDINTIAVSTDYGETVSGSSAAAAHVAGAWAILKQVAPSESVQQILDRFKLTGVPLTDPRNSLIRSRIQVDQAIGPGTLELDAATYAVAEGQTVTVNVRRVGGTAGTASVRCVTANGSATEPGDYTAVNTLLNWANTESGSKPCPIQAKTDGVADPGETFSVFLTLPTNAPLSPPPASTSAVITVNDVPPPPTIGFAQDEFLRGEGSQPAGTTMMVRIVRSGNTAVYASARLSTTNGYGVPNNYGAAISGQDYAGLSNFLVEFNPGVTEVTKGISIFNDSNPEPDEYFNLLLSQPSAGAVLGNADATGNIPCNDNFQCP